jgi:hypothetical protein
MLIVFSKTMSDQNQKKQHPVVVKSHHPVPGMQPEPLQLQTTPTDNQIQAADDARSNFLLQLQDFGLSL